MSTVEFGAILLAGGRASRVDGAAKPLFEVGGRSLIASAVAAVRDAGAGSIVVAGPELDPALDVVWVREDPPFGGPAAGASAALAALTPTTEGEPGSAPEWTFLLACDLPPVARAVAVLVDALPLLPSDADGVCLADASSRPQWLIGLYRTAALRAAASALPDDGRDAAVRALVEDLAITVLSVDDTLTRDVDTWEDLADARAAAERPTEEAP